jgi:hypothetical protein
MSTVLAVLLFARLSVADLLVHELVDTQISPSKPSLSSEDSSSLGRFFQPSKANGG